MSTQWLSFLVIVWQVLSLVYRLLSEGKMATQREAYYCLVQNFKDQNEFNCILQGSTCDVYLVCDSVLLCVFSAVFRCGSIDTVLKVFSGHISKWFRLHCRIGFVEGVFIVVCVCVFSSIHSSIESLNTVRGFFHELSILIFQSCHTYICTYTVIQYHLYTACSKQYSTNHCDPSHVPVSLFS